MKCFLVVFVLAFPWVANAEGPAQQLARILAEKGLLTNDELVNIERAEGDDAVRLLSMVLYQKGILTQSEMARVGEVRFVPAVTTAIAAAAQPAQLQTPAPKAVEQASAVTSVARFPVQIYGNRALECVLQHRRDQH
jgi:hypothetical protein